jgi:predicted transglutaminase-like cysteine proteinase
MDFSSAGVSIALLAAWIVGCDAATVRLGEPALAPFAHTVFCQSYPRDCVPRAGELPPSSAARTAELDILNREINVNIVFRARDPAGRAGRSWKIAPETGDCNDYAVTKRHYLLRRGWPSAALLLAEVALKSGEHHLVLVVRMKDTAFVLDNREAGLLPIQAASRAYRWIRIESGEHPKFWNEVAKN